MRMLKSERPRDQVVEKEDLAAEAAEVEVEVLGAPVVVISS